jgi:hypothetical protein
VVLLEPRQPAALALDLRGRLLKPRLQCSGDNAVLRLAGIELATRPARLELGALHRQPLAAQALLMLARELADRLGRGADPGRRHRLQEGRGDRALEPQAAERLAGLARVQVAVPDAGIAGDVAVAA